MTGRRCLMCEGAECHGAACRVMGAPDAWCPECGNVLPFDGAACWRCLPSFAGGTRIPAEALAAVERVLAHRAAAVAEVPGQERWRQTTVDHQTAKVLSHAAEAAIGTTADVDTGEHPLAHAAARALLGLALALRERP